MTIQPDDSNHSMIPTGTGPTAACSSSPRLPRASDYRAGRVLLALVLLLLLQYALLWDLPGLDTATLLHMLAVGAAWLGLDWLSAFFGRIDGDWFKIGMLSALAVLFGYGLLQWLGVRLDRRCLGRVLPAATADEKDAPSRRQRLVTALSGRPALLCSALGRGDSHALHFGFGRTHLLEPLRFGLWAFPVIGFIGTVLGVSQAVKDLPSAMQDEAALSRVLGSLHLAFDTTFIGLAASVVLMLLLYALEAAWRLNDALSELPSRTDD
jgi:hypothetical protein